MTTATVHATRQFNAAQYFAAQRRYLDRHHRAMQWLDQQPPFPPITGPILRPGRARWADDGRIAQ